MTSVDDKTLFGMAANVETPVDNLGSSPIQNGEGVHGGREPERRLAPWPEPDEGEVPDLPHAARINPAAGAEVCPWLDRYIEFSRKWSPRAFDGFHVACGLFVLSTVAARRVRVDMGKERYTSLYIALTARTSLYAKSSTAEIGLQALQQAGLDWLLAADASTPQKFIADLTTRLPDNYDQLDEGKQIRAQLRVGFAGQRGWFYDEFGMHVSAMMREAGIMADFRGLLRRMDDTPIRYEYGSIARGSDIIERPYLALLANMTPDDLRPFARKGSGLWGDGFLARFALITPPEGERMRDQFPPGERSILPEIISPLVEWHHRLGVPVVNLVDNVNQKGEPSGGKTANVFPRHAAVLKVPKEVHEAFYAYHDGLLDLIERTDNNDLDGNYARLAEKALRVAALLASMDDQASVSLAHWARAQTIVEDWRAGLHRLYDQINRPSPSQERENEEAVLKIIQRNGPSTAAEVARYIRNLSSKEAVYVLDGLVETRILAAEKTQRNTKRYGFPQMS